MSTELLALTAPSLLSLTIKGFKLDAHLDLRSVLGFRGFLVAFPFFGDPTGVGVLSIEGTTVLSAEMLSLLKSGKPDALIRIEVKDIGF